MDRVSSHCLAKEASTSAFQPFRQEFTPLLEICTQTLLRVRSCGRVQSFVLPRPSFLRPHEGTDKEGVIFELSTLN